jgi:hypothetical protein
MTTKHLVTLTMAFALTFAAAIWIPTMSSAHCDTMDGPVIAAAKQALETKNVNLILMWVQEKDESEIKKAFEKTLAIRKLSPEAKELADAYFFETLVRIHRAGEGAPYTGLKPAGTNLEPAMAEADKALESGSVDHLAKHLAEAVAVGIRERFHHAMENKKHAAESIKAGRAYVKSYVEYVHYVERLDNDASGKSAEHHASEGGEAHGGHHQ